MTIQSIRNYILVLLLGLSLGYLFFGGSTTSDTTQNELDHQHTQNKSSQVYTCSMHPNIRQEEPGNCPICGMKLIPAVSQYAESNLFSMTDAAMNLAQIQTTKVKVSASQKVIQLPAKVVADESQRSVVSAQYSGRIVTLNARFVGQQVKKGEVIARVYSPELREIHRELLIAKKSNESTFIEVSKDRLSQLLVAESTIQEMEHSSEIWESYPIVARSSGVVSALTVSDQSTFLKGQNLIQLDDLSKVWVEAFVQESDISLIKLNQEVKLTLPNGKMVNLKVDFINPSLNESSRTYVIRMNVKNTMDLKPGSLSTAKLSIALPKSTYIPKTAVLWTGTNSLVYVQIQSQKEPSFELREVVLGINLSNEVEVVSGLKERENVVTNGVFRLDSAVQLAGLPSMMTYTKPSKMNLEMSSFQVEAKTLAPESIQQLNDVVKTYLLLKNSLVESDLAASLNAAKRLDQSIEEVNHSRFDPDAHDIWTSRSEAMHLEVQTILKSKDLGVIRLSFITLSTALIELMKQIPFTKSVQFVQFCPMADTENGAYWLSEKKEIKNPYFGSLMLNCGETIEEINPNN